MDGWPEIGWIDIAMLAVVALSALAGVVRGLTYEVLSLLAWVAAWFAGLWLGPPLAPHLPIGVPASALNSVAAFACAFLVVLIVAGLAARAVSALVAKTLLRPLDRMLGGRLRRAAWGAGAARGGDRRFVHAGRDVRGVARVARRGLVECDPARAGAARRARRDSSAGAAQRLTAGAGL